MHGDGMNMKIQNIINAGSCMSCLDGRLHALVSLLKFYHKLKTSYTKKLDFAC